MGGLDGRKRILPSEKTKILQCPAMKIERAFNCMPRYLRDKTGIKTETFKKHLDMWLSGIPDQPKCGRYSGCNVANSNSIQYQCKTNNINFDSKFYKRNTRNTHTHKAVNL